MAIRVNKLLKELNIGVATLENMLSGLGYKELPISINSKLPDDIVVLVRELYYDNGEFLNLIKMIAARGIYSNQKNLTLIQSNVSCIDFDDYNKRQGQKRNQDESLIVPVYSDTQSFWISELAILSLDNNVTSIGVGSFDDVEGLPLYSVLIGPNGVGKSSLLKEIVDFFVDLHSCLNKSESSKSLSNKGRLKGVKYHIDGVECEVFRLKHNYLARINGHFCSLCDLRLPTIVACNFGAFDKFPIQKVNGSAQTRYDVPCYKYVGAHVNGSMISSSAIAFRLLFSLTEKMTERQCENLCSILDFIGYDHRISLSYSFILKSKKDGAAREKIFQRVEKDREYNSLSKQEKNAKMAQLYNFYKLKTSTGKSQYDYEIDIDNKTVAEESLIELQKIYKLKQYELVNSTNVIFHKQGCDVTSDDMSSGEFAMLSTVLSISTAAYSPHTIVLLDEPELSLHPNWQMMLVDNLDRALKNQVCHLLMATHSHLLLSDLPLRRSSVVQLEKDVKGNQKGMAISESTYGWSPEEVLLKVFKMSTDRNRYLAEMVGIFIQKISDNDISMDNVKEKLTFLNNVAIGLSDVDPMKKIISTITEEFDNNG